MSGTRARQGLVHGGPRGAPRHEVVATRLAPVAGILRAGRVVMDEVAALFADEGFRGGVLELGGARFHPFRYVLPALSADAIHAAWYSATHAPEGVVTVERATAVVGWRDEAPFLHCHGVWAGTGGHMLPFDSVLAADAVVQGLGSVDASFEASPDAETRFTLFGPVGGGTGPDLLVRLRPDEDVVLALEALCRDAGITAAAIHGIGSIAEIRFAEGGRMDCIATEVRITAGRYAEGRAHVAIEAVDVDGHVAAGVLERGDNPVGVTFELAIQRLEPGR